MAGAPTPEIPRCAKGALHAVNDSAFAVQGVGLKFHSYGRIRVKGLSGTLTPPVNLQCTEPWKTCTHGSMNFIPTICAHIADATRSSPSQAVLLLLMASDAHS